MRYATTPVVATGTWQAAPAASPQKIRWGAVFAGTVLGMGLLALLSTLWFALAYGSGLETVRADLEWYVGISAIVCLFIGGLISGWLSGVRGAAAGLFNGMAIWAMVLIATLVLGVPSILNVFSLGRVTQLTQEGTGQILAQGVDTALWATFWAVLGGLVACALGGALGGAFTKPANAELAVAAPIEDPNLGHEHDRGVVRDHDTEVVPGEVEVHDDDTDDLRRSRAS